MLLARVSAAPVEGRANTALEALIAKALGVGKRRVSLARGETSRLKALEVEGLTLDEIRERLG